jgi:hypothetical protein
VEMVFLISDHARQQYGSAYIDTTLIRRIRRNSLAVGSTTTIGLKIYLYLYKVTDSQRRRHHAAAQVPR